MQALNLSGPHTGKTCITPRSCIKPQQPTITVPMLYNFFSSWELLPNVPTTRLRHACSRVTMRNTVYLAVIGGSKDLNTALSTIDLFNMNSRMWESFPAIKLPETMGAIRGSVVMKINEHECDMMLFSASAPPLLHICMGNYNWTSMDLAINYPYYIGVPASLMLPCGIDPLA